MPRQPRLNLPGLYNHVMVRGIERRAIFRTTADRLDFLRRLGAGLKRTGCRCFSWALMSNHLHLLILSGVRGLVELMHPLLTGYAVTFNLKYRRVGHLFQNRYKAIICEEDPYFLELVRYIALQPVQAGLVRTPEELVRYPWTSYPALAGAPGEPWLEVADVLGRFDRDLTRASQVFERFVLDRWNQGRRKDLEGGGLLRSVGGMSGALELRRTSQPQMSDVRILGSGSFVEQVLQQADALERIAQDVRKQWSIQEMQNAVATFAGVDASTLTSVDRRHKVSSARAMLIYAAREWLGMKGAELQERFRMASGSLSKAYARGRQMAKDRRLLQFLKKKKGSNVP